MNNKRIYFIRHCKAEGQEPTAALTKDGLKSAKNLVEILKAFQIDYLISSPYERAIQTILPFSQDTGLPLHIHEGLSERVLSKEPMDDWLEKLKRTFLHKDLSFPGGESSDEALNRIKEVINEVIGRDDVTNVGIVSHGNILALLFNHYDNTFGFDQWLQMKNPDIFLIENNILQQVELKEILSN